MDIPPGGEEEVISMPMSTSFPAISDSSRLRLLAAASTPEGKPPERGGSEGRKTVRYRECLKNHAANIGGHVTDGCGEFMSGGEEGSPESLRCAACECHRNFHRREVEGEEAQTACDVCYHKRLVTGTNLLPLPFPQAAMGVLGRPLPQIIAAAPVNNNMKNSPLFVPSPESEEQADGNLPSGKKRFRTKFTHEQKERMLAFAQKVGWRLQKHEEAAVQSFCQEVGVRRHVLKVWMHNNKHAMATKPHADSNNHNNDNTAAANSSSNNSTP